MLCSFEASSELGCNRYISQRTNRFHVLARSSDLGESRGQRGDLAGGGAGSPVYRMVRHIQSGSTGCVGSTLRGETGPVGRSESPKTIKFRLERRGFGMRSERRCQRESSKSGNQETGSHQHVGASFSCSRAPRARTMHGPGSPAWGSTRHIPAPHLPAYLPSARAGSPSTVSNRNPPLLGLPSASPHSRPSGRTRVLKVLRASWGGQTLPGP